MVSHARNRIDELPFERSFGWWCREEGVERRSFLYPRPSAGGEAWGHRLSPRGRASGRVLVVHGAGNDAFFALTGLYAELLRRRLELFTFDVDGHGRGSSTVLTTESAGECITAALAAWGDRGEDLPLHTVGVSLGGSILLHSLPDLGRRIASAALLSAPLRIELSSRSLRREMGPALWSTLWRERARYGLTGLVPSFGPFRRGLYPLRLGETPAPGLFGYVEVLNGLLERMRLPSAAAATEIPVLLVYGERDLLVPPEQGRRLSGLIPASELLLLNGETHLSTPLAPAAISRLLRWIDEHR